MTYFHPLDGSVLLRARAGVFSEHQIYHNDKGELFARRGSGYIRLMANNATSLGNVFWEQISLDQPWSVKVSKLVLDTQAPAAKAA